MEPLALPAKFKPILGELKRLLINSKDLGVVMRYFMDHLGEDQDFIAVGQPVPPERVCPVLLPVVEAFFKRKVRMVGTMLIRVPGADFFHGGFLAEGHVGNIIFFKDIDMGMIALAPASCDTAYFLRFTTQLLGGPDLWN